MKIARRIKRNENAGSLSLFTSLILGSIFVILLFISFDYFFFSRQAERVSLDNASRKSLERNRFLNTVTTQNVDKMLFISKSDIFAEFTKSGHINGDLGRLFLSAISLDSTMMQLRFIDNKGNEVIRYQREFQGEPPIKISKKNLQNKAHRDYFREGINSKDTIVFSELDLNVENYYVEKPFRPTYRISIPVRRGKETIGILIGNYFAGDLLKDLFNAPLYSMKLFDSQGYILYATKPNLRWSFYQKNPFRIDAKFANAIGLNAYRGDDYYVKRLRTPFKNDLYLSFSLSPKVKSAQQIVYIKRTVSVAFVVLLISSILFLIVQRTYNYARTRMDEANEVMKVMNSNESIIIVADGKRVLKGNDKFCSFFKVDSLEDFNRTGGCIGKFIVENEGETFISKDEFLDSIKKREFSKINQYKVQIESPKGDVIPFAISVSKFDEVSYVLTLTDISNYISLEKSIERSEEKYKMLFSESEDAIFITDLATGLIADCNPFACSLLEKDYDEIVGFKQNLILSKNDENTECDQVHSSQRVVVTTNGKIIPVSVRSSRFKLGDQEFIQEVVRDITDLKRRENELNKLVKLEVNRRASQDKLIRHQSKMADMGNMISAISHQWKQPLNIIMMSNDLIEDEFEADQISRDTLQTVHETINRQVEFLSETISDFREFLRPSKEKDRFDLKQAVKEIRSILYAQLNIANVELKIEGDEISAFGLANEFKQVVLNLIINSIDNFEEKSIPERKIGIRVEQENDSAVVYLQDNGGGIDESLLPEKLFESYITTKGDKGTGIGLSLSKRLIEESMDGELIAYNKDGGACFQIELPISDTERITTDLSILYVEDEEIARGTFGHILSKKYENVYIAVDGKDGMEKLDLYDVNLVVTDINMPFASGNELASYAHQKNKDIHVIALTGASDAIKDPDQFKVILKKPTRKKELIEIIDNLFS